MELSNRLISLPKDILVLLLSKFSREGGERLLTLRSLMQCAKSFSSLPHVCILNSACPRFIDRYYEFSGGMEGKLERHKEAYHYGLIVHWKTKRLKDCEYCIVPVLEPSNAVCCLIRLFAG
jgi:hypothetical protein